jgi:hypothetical protein
MDVELDQTAKLQSVRLSLVSNEMRGMEVVMKIVVLILIGILAVLPFVLYRLNVFTAVPVSEREVGPFLLVYKKHIGDYREAGKVTDEVYYDLRDKYSIDTTKGFGLYYDNPKETPTDQMRSILGVIVEGRSAQELGEVSEKYGVVEFSKTKAVVAEFPFKGPMSIMVGVFKVYPKLNAYIEQRGLPQSPIFEIYDQPNQRLTYISPHLVESAVLLRYLGKA